MYQSLCYSTTYIAFGGCCIINSNNLLSVTEILEINQSLAMPQYHNTLILSSKSGD